jgi:hypothetical protein
MSNETIPGLYPIATPSSAAMLWINDPNANPEDRSFSPAPGWFAALALPVPANFLLPIGTILMFDANASAGSSGGASGAWVDNVTMPGWYACIPANSVWGCPDLTDRFILGKAIAGAGASGGSNSHTIALTELPAHTHNVVLGSHYHTIPTYGSGSSGSGIVPVTIQGSPSNINTSSLDLGTKTTDYGTGGGSAMDTHPAYYSAIYIRRCE